MGPRWMRGYGPFFIAMLGITSLLACGRDGGSRPTVPPPPPPGADVVIAGLVPARTVVGDTVVVRGSGFGTEADSVTFAGTGGTRVGAQIVFWSDTELKVLVPAGAIDGPVAAHVGDADSNAEDFSVAPRLISYTADLIPQIFENINIGCIGCHGGQDNLYLDTAQSLMQGTSPVTGAPFVKPRDSAGSTLYQKVSPTPPFGVRMPYLGTPLNDVQLQLIADWIDQGARDN